MNSHECQVVMIIKRPNKKGTVITVYVRPKRATRLVVLSRYFYRSHNINEIKNIHLNFSKFY